MTPISCAVQTSNRRRTSPVDPAARCRSSPGRYGWTWPLNAASTGPTDTLSHTGADKQSYHYSLCAPAEVGSFEKGLAGRGGWREEIPSYARDSDLFSVPFFLGHPSEKGTQFWDQFLLYLGPC